MDLKTELRFKEVRDKIEEINELLDNSKLEDMTAKELFNLFNMATSNNKFCDLSMVLCYVKGGLQSYSKNGITRL